MKVNLRKIKPLYINNSNYTAKVIDNGKWCLRHIEINSRFGVGIYFYHEDALELRNFLNKTLPDA